MNDEIQQTVKQALKALHQSLQEQRAKLAGMTGDDAHERAQILLEEACDAIYDQLQTWLPYDRVGVALLQQDGAMLRARWVRAEYSDVDIYPGYSAPMAASNSLQQILTTGAPRIINDLRAYLRKHPQSRSTQRMTSEGIRSSLTGPLIVDGSPVGFIFFSSRRTDQFDDSHVALLRSITEELSQVLERGVPTAQVS